MPQPAETSNRRRFEDTRQARRLSSREAISERRFIAFRPFQPLKTDGSHRVSEYQFRHARQAVRDGENIEAFFHAQRMRAAGYLWDNNGRRWVRRYSMPGVA